MASERNFTLYDADGRELIQDDDHPDGFAVPGVYTFSGLMGGAWKTFWHGFHDEAIKHSRENALAMRRDCFIMGLLRERKEGTLSLKWHIECDNPKDNYQKTVADALTKIIKGVPRYRRIKRWLLEALWYGRYAAQVRWHWTEMDLPVPEYSGPIVPGVKPTTQLRRHKVLTVANSMPVSGDKVDYRWDGTPYILVGGSAPPASYPYSTVIPTTAGGEGFLLDRPGWRNRFIIHKHDPDDADYFQPEMAGGVHGVGIRSRIYWCDWLRKDWIGAITDALDRYGLGIVVIYYDASNSKAKEEAIKAGKQYSRRSVIVMPQSPDQSWKGGSIQVVETPINGMGVLQELIKHYEEHIERFIIGQTLSSKTEGSGLGGTGVAEMHADTKQNIIAADAEDLDETITGSDEEPGLLNLIKRYTFPEADFPLRMVSDVDDWRADKKLDGVEKASRIGVHFPENAVRQLTGIPGPEGDEPVIGGQQAQPGQPGAPGDGQPQEAGQPQDIEAMLDGEPGMDQGGAGPMDDGSGGQPPDQGPPPQPSPNGAPQNYDASSWNHKRGQPRNKGQFGPGGGGANGKPAPAAGRGAGPQAPATQVAPDMPGQKTKPASPAQQPAQQPDPQQQLQQQKAASVSKLGVMGKQALETLGAMEHTAKEFISRQVEKLPGPLKLPVVGLFKLSFATYTAGRKAVEAVGRERGFSEDEISRVSAMVGITDMIAGGKGMPMGMAAAGLGGFAAVGSFVPVGSLGYLAWSTAKDPMATLRAARRAVAGLFGQPTGATGAQPSGGQAPPEPQPAHFGDIEAVHYADPATWVASGQQSHDRVVTIHTLLDRMRRLGPAAPAWEASVYAALDRAPDLRSAMSMADRSYLGVRRAMQEADRGGLQRYDAGWHEERGQPQNAGQFAKGGSVENRGTFDPNQDHIDYAGEHWRGQPRDSDGTWTESYRRQLLNDIENAAAETDTNPSEAQKETGNYRKGKVRLHGLHIAIENPKGSTRSGEGKDGKPWSVKMKHHYGYIKCTESEADGDHVDCFIGPHPESEIVFVVDQVKPNGKFDEHKVMLGFTTEDDAKEGYLACYSPGWKGFGGIRPMTMDEFAWWLDHGDTGEPAEDQDVEHYETPHPKFTGTITDKLGRRYTYVEGKRVARNKGAGTAARTSPAAPAAKQPRHAAPAAAPSHPAPARAPEPAKAAPTGKRVHVQGYGTYRQVGDEWVSEANPDYRASGASMDRWKSRGLVHEDKPAAEPDLKPAAKPSGKLSGETTDIPTPDGESVKARYEVRDLASVNASNRVLPGGAFQDLVATGEYPAGLQPRNYTANASEKAKVLSFASKMVPTYWISDHPDATSGPPVINEDGKVLSGNGRHMALEMSRNVGTYEKYKAALIKKASQFGIDPEQVRGMKEPALYRVVDLSEKEQVKFARSGNIAPTQSQGVAETAAAMSHLIPADISDQLKLGPETTFSQAVTAPSGAGFRAKLLESIRSQAATMEPDLFEKDGKLTEKGTEFVRQMLLTKFLPPKLIQDLGERRRQLMNGIEAAIPQMLLLQRGQGGVNVSPQLREALEVFSRNPEMKTPADVDSVLSQGSLFGGMQEPISPAARMMLDFLVANRDTPNKLRKGLVGLAGSLDMKGGGLFGDQMGDTADIAAEALGVARQDGATFGYEGEVEDARREAIQSGHAADEVESVILRGQEAGSSETPAEEPEPAEQPAPSGGSAAETAEVAAQPAAQPSPEPDAEADIPSEAKPKQPGFTGTTTDSLGRVYHWVDGKRVAAPEEPAAGQPSGQQDEVANGLEAASQESDGGRLQPGPVATDARETPGGELPEARPGIESDRGLSSVPDGQDERRTGGLSSGDGPGDRPARREGTSTGGPAAGTQRREPVLNETPQEESLSQAATADNPTDTRGANFQYTSRDFFKGGLKAKFKANMEAVRTLDAIKAEGRETATPEEQQILSRFVGWGQFPAVFNWGDQSWADERRQLQSMMSSEEWDEARRSTLNAHYTSPEIVDAHWKMAQRLGFNGGRFLETSAGIGYYLGMMPAELQARTKSSAVELDSTSGNMLKLLYPQANVEVKGFQDHLTPDNFYDLVASNVPFGAYKVHDPHSPHFNKFQANIHDYFFLKSAKIAKPGGLVMHITSTGTMDKPDSTIRQELDKDCEFVAAIRFPGQAHKANAGTDVVTDMVILRKRIPGLPETTDETPPEAQPKKPGFTGTTVDSLGRLYYWVNGKRVKKPDWLSTTTVPDPDGGEPISVNQYFADHPEQILGRLDRSGTMYRGDEKNVSSTDDYQQLLEAAIQRLPEGIAQSGKTTTAAFEPSKLPAPGEVKDGGFAIKDGKLYARSGGSLVPQKASAAQIQRIQAHLEVRDAIRKCLNDQIAGQDATAARAELNRVYDAFVAKYGSLNSKENKKAFGEDPDSPVLLAVEKKSLDGKKFSKADIFVKDTVRSVAPVEKADSTPEALGVSLHETGRVDIERMAKLTGRSKLDIAHELVSQGMAYQDPADGWQPAAQYLSGNVRRKLALARAAAAADSQFDANVKALEAVQPEDLDAGDIEVKIGAPWIPATDIAEFAAQLVGGGPRDFEIAHVEATGEWQAHYSSSGERSVANRQLARDQWGTPRKRFTELLNAALNNTSVTVYDPDPETDGKKVINKQATDDANAKVQEIKDNFKEWIWTDDERRDRLARYYNDNFNNVVPMKYDGSHQKFPGMNPSIVLHKHIKDFVWRVVTNGTALAGHEVGTGKTFAAIASAMELRRLGLAKKPMIACLKANVEAITNDARLLYPGAKILSTADMFDAAKRKQTISRIATGDYDLIVMTHDNLNMLRMKPETVAKYIREEIAELEAAKSASEEENPKKDNRVVKALEKAKANLEAKLKEALDDTRKDDAVFFEDLGIDSMFIDEAHKYKSLPCYTKQQRLKGVPNTRSDRATSMLMRTKWLQEHNKGRGVIFLTGTPVANTMAELYNMQRYLQPQQLKERGLQSFDAWANVFGDVQTKMEFTVAGDYKPMSRFARFVNLPELRQMSGQVIDVQRADDLKKPDGSPAIVRPNRHDTAIVAPKSDAMKNLMASLRERAEKISQRGGPPSKGDDNMLVICTDGRKGAIDMRLLDPNAPDDPNSKTNLAVKQILEIHKAQPGVTQLLFSDVGVHPSKVKKRDKDEDELDATSALADLAGGAEGFHLYGDIINKLVKGGIPREKIADFSTLEGAKKEAAAQGLRDGTILVGLGSTEKLGTGVNVQNKLKALHHLDVPWLPAHIEQRDGRAHRQCNENKDIDIYRYVSEGSLDQTFWQIIDTKSRFIQQVMSGKAKSRQAREDDSEVLSADQLMAAASGDPRIMHKINLEEDVRNLKAAESRHVREQNRFKDAVRRGTQHVSDLRQTAKNLQDQADALKAQAGDDEDFGIDIGGQGFSDRKEAAAALEAAIQDTDARYRPQWVGRFRGLDIHKNTDGRLYLQKEDSDMKIATGASLGSIEAVLRQLPTMAEKTRQQADKAESDMQKIYGNIGKPFPKSAELKAKQEEVAKIEAELRADRVETGGAAQPAPEDVEDVLGGQEHYAGTWDESKHPRGQPNNAGQFGPGGGKSKQNSGRNAQTPAPKAPVPPKQVGTGEHQKQTATPAAQQPPQHTAVPTPWDPGAIAGSQHRPIDLLNSMYENVSQHGYKDIAATVHDIVAGMSATQAKQLAKDFDIAAPLRSKAAVAAEITRKITWRKESYDRTQFRIVSPDDTEDNYVQQAMANLKKTSRTAGGVVDTSASAGKAAQMAEGLTGQQAAEHAARNYEGVMRQLYREAKGTLTPEKVNALADQVNQSINKGITKEGVLLRQDDSHKYPYTAVGNLPLARQQFAQEFSQRLADPNADPIETAAWVEWRVNMTDHAYADGVGKTSKALAAIPLMKAGLPLPNYGDNKEFYKFSQKTPYDPHNGGESYLDESWEKFKSYYRTKFRAQFSKAVRDVEKQYPPANQDLSGLETFDRHQADGQWTPQRQALHKGIVFQAHIPAAQGQKTYTVMGGGPASGKSSVVHSGLVELPEHHVAIDADAIKGKLPEYAAMIGAKDDRAASYVHEESSHLTKEIQNTAFAAGQHALLDGTGDNSVDSMMKKINQARAAGYKVNGEYVTCSTNEAVRRNYIRAHGGEKAAADGYQVHPHEMNSKGTGRLPPEKMLRKTHKGVSGVLPKLMEMGAFDNCRLWDSENKTDGKPTLVASSQGKQITIHRDDLWQQFLDKAKEESAKKDGATH